MNMHGSYKQAIQLGALAYAQADKSDPFAYRRAVCHITNGVTDPRFARNGDRIDCYYSADPILEKRTLPKGIQFMGGGNTYEVSAYRNMVRP
jgi:hypothetical protein